MRTALKNYLLNILAEKERDSDSGFTLVERIVVVVIIGILSSIAIPSFQSASDKAKQKEASTIVASWVKAAQAYYTENSDYARNTGHLSEYISVAGCSTTGAACKTAAAVAPAATATKINSPSGNYEITMAQRGTITDVLAKPAGTYANAGLGVSGCFNTTTGSTKVIDQKEKGAAKVKAINC